MTQSFIRIFLAIMIGLWSPMCCCRAAVVIGAPCVSLAGGVVADREGTGEASSAFEAVGGCDDAFDVVAWTVRQGEPSGAGVGNGGGEDARDDGGACGCCIALTSAEERGVTQGKGGPDRPLPEPCESCSGCDGAVFDLNQGKNWGKNGTGLSGGDCSVMKWPSAFAAGACSGRFSGGCGVRPFARPGSAAEPACRPANRCALRWHCALIV